MVNRAHAQTVRDERFPLGRRVRSDVRGVEQAQLPEVANRAAVLVSRQHYPAELHLVQTLLDLSNNVPSLEGILDVRRFTLVIGSSHLPEGQQRGSTLWEVTFDKWAICFRVLGGVCRELGR